MKSGTSCLKCCVAWICGALMLAAGLSIAALGQAGRWLSAADTPQPADAIVVLAGAFERTFYAADLYAAGHAPRIYLSTPARERVHRMLDDLGVLIPTEQEISLRVLERKGVPTARIQVFPIASLSTVEEAQAVKRLLAGRRATILIVTSPYHLRRVRMVYADMLAGSEITPRFVATPYEPFPTDWWHDQSSARQVVLELAKILFYLAGGRFHAANPG